MRRFHEQRMDYLRRDFEIRRIEMLSPAKQVAGNSLLSVE
jgi:hypothetical protein